MCVASFCLETEQKEKEWKVFPSILFLYASESVVFRVQGGRSPTSLRTSHRFGGMRYILDQFGIVRTNLV